MAEPEVPARRTATLIQELLRAQERKDTGTSLCRTVPIGHLVWIKAGLTALRVPACGGSDNKARLVRVNRSYHQTHSELHGPVRRKVSLFLCNESGEQWAHTDRNKHLYSGSSKHTHTLDRPWNGPYQTDGKWDVKGLFRYAHSILTSSRASFVLFSCKENSKWFLSHFVLEVLQGLLYNVALHRSTQTVIPFLGLYPLEESFWCC